MLRETKADRATDSVESVSSDNKSELSWLDAPDTWVRAAPDNSFSKTFGELTNLMGYALQGYGKDLEKQAKNLKSF